MLLHVKALKGGKAFEFFSVVIIRYLFLEPLYRLIKAISAVTVTHINPKDRTQLNKGIVKLHFSRFIQNSPEIKLLVIPIVDSNGQLRLRHLVVPHRFR